MVSCQRLLNYPCLVRHGLDDRYFLSYKPPASLNIFSGPFFLSLIHRITASITKFRHLVSSPHALVIQTSKLSTNNVVFFPVLGAATSFRGEIKRSHPPFLNGSYFRGRTNVSIERMEEWNGPSKRSLQPPFGRRHTLLGTRVAIEVHKVASLQNSESIAMEDVGECGPTLASVLPFSVPTSSHSSICYLPPHRPPHIFTHNVLCRHLWLWDVWSREVVGKDEGKRHG